MNESKVKKVPVSLYITEATAARMEKLQMTTSVPKTWLIEKAINRMIDEIDIKGVGAVWD